jgi:NAD(P)H-hydrate epimerase
MTLKDIPFITTVQMVEVDRLMIEVYGIQLVQMMEVAGRQLARLSVERFLDDDSKGKRITVLAGSGGNGGGALVCARVLLNWGADVSVFLTKPAESYRGSIRNQIEILASYPLGLGLADDLRREEKTDLIIDGIIGYNLVGAPRNSAAKMIQWANNQISPVLALDVPSGVDSTTGEVYLPTIQASATMTLALPKIGLKKAGKEVVGELYLADIGVPPGLYAKPPLNLDVDPIFNLEEIIHLTDPFS